MARRGLSDTALLKTAELYAERLRNLPGYARLIDGPTGVVMRPDVPEGIFPDASPVGIVRTITRQADPSDRGHYTKWVVQRIVDQDPMLKTFFDEFNSCQIELQNRLQRFDTIKAYLPDRKFRDINFFKTVESFYDFLDFVEDVEFKSVRERDAEEEARLLETGAARLLLNDDAYKVLRIMSYDAAIHFGRNTRWCVTTVDGKHCNNYLREGCLFFILRRGSSQRFAIACNHKGLIYEVRNEENIFQSWQGVSSHEAAVIAVRDEIDRHILRQLPKPSPEISSMVWAVEITSDTLAAATRRINIPLVRGH